MFPGVRSVKDLSRAGLQQHVGRMRETGSEEHGNRLLPVLQRFEEFALRRINAA